MNTNTDGASPAIVITSAKVDLTEPPNYFLTIKYNLSEITRNELGLRVFCSRKSPEGARIFEVPKESKSIHSGVQTILLSWSNPFLHRGDAILRVQLVKSGGPESNIQDCVVGFPAITPVTVVQNEKITVSWEGWEDVNPYLYFLEEISTGRVIQKQSAKFGDKEMTISPDEAIKNAGVFQCRNILAYGLDPKKYPLGNDDTYVLREEGWSKPVSMIGKPVSITSVTCGKAANGKFTLDVKWQNSILIFPVRIIIRSGAAETRQELCPEGASSFIFTDLGLDPQKSYTVSAYYYKDSAMGPESEPIPVLHRVPAKFNLNYYENGGQTNLEARWEKLVPECDYRLIVSRDGVPGEMVGPASGSLVLGRDADNSGKRITGTIRAVKGVSSGPWCDPVPAPFVSESAFVFDNLGRLRQVDAGTKQKHLFNFDERGNITDRKVI